MTGFNAIFGLDEAAFNGFIKKTHEVAHKYVFVGDVDVTTLGLPGLKSISYNFVDPPRVSLVPSTAFQAARLADLGTAAEAGIDPPTAAILSAAASQASFELRVEHVDVKINYGDGTNTQLQAAMTGAFTTAIDTGGTLTPRLGSLKFTVVGEPAMTDILNKALVPTLRERIQTKILKPTVIPPLGPKQLQVSPPTVITGKGRLLATTCAVPTVADSAPLDGPWPDGSVFVAVDFPFANDAIAKVLVPRLKTAGAGVVVKKINFLFGTSTIKADYRLEVTSLKLSAVSDSPTQFRGSAEIATYVHLYAKNIGSWTGHGTTSAKAVAEAGMSNTNELTVVVKRLEDVRLKIDFRNTPKFIDKAIGNLPTIIWSLAREPIDAVLAAQPPIALAELPRWTYNVKSVRLHVFPSALAVRTLVAPDGRQLVGAIGQPSARVGSIPS